MPSVSFGPVSEGDDSLRWKLRPMISLKRRERRIRLRVTSDQLICKREVDPTRVVTDLARLLAHPWWRIPRAYPQEDDQLVRETPQSLYRLAQEQSAQGGENWAAGSLLKIMTMPDLHRRECQDDRRARRPNLAEPQDMLQL